MAIDVPPVLPLFPLPDHVLLIGLPMPYRVVEPRYRALVDDLIGMPPSSRWISIPRLEDGWQGRYDGAPPFHALAAIGLVRTIRPEENGQFHIRVEGLQRCQLEEVPSTRLYRLARPLPLPDLPHDLSQAELTHGVGEVLGLVDELRARLGKRGEVIKALVDNQDDLPAMIDRLGAAVIADADVRQEFLESRRLPARLVLLKRVLISLLAPRTRPTGWDPSAN